MTAALDDELDTATKSVSCFVYCIVHIPSHDTQ